LEGLFSTISNAGNWIKDTLGEGYDMIMGSEDTMLPEEKVNEQKKVTFGNSSEGGSNQIDPIKQNDINTAVSDGKKSLLDASINNFSYSPGAGGFNTEQLVKGVREVKDTQFEDEWHADVDRESEMVMRDGELVSRHDEENLKRYGTTNLADVATLNLQKHNRAQNAQKQRVGAALNSFSDALGKIRSDTRDPYLYDSASIFGKGINT